jgi:histidyl-tRNA synthetase
MLTQRPRGTADILPGEVERWQQLEAQVRDTFECYHYSEIRTPTFEHTELFSRGVGETTDIVEREMYTFKDRSDRSVTLRPEGTASVVRSYVENKLYGNPSASKLYYIGSMFRYEKPQKGRYRELHQYGCEVFGSDAPAVDAEVISLNLHILERIGLKDLTLELNSVGCGVCRPLHKEEMIRRLKPQAHRLCQDCQSRLERNPLRIFDCKHEQCHAILQEVGAPTILASLCEDCRTHFDGVKTYLQAMGIVYEINEHLVRGLDYYTRTAWECTVPGFSSVAGGGRYNALVAQVGGPETPGIGFAGGLERALLVLEEQSGAPEHMDSLDVFVAVADDVANSAAMTLLDRLRRADIRADRDYLGKGLKAQFKMADRVGASFVAVLGETEVTAGTVSLKRLSTGEQSVVAVADVVKNLEEELKQG